ncbi:SRPBCC domain-containing protein [Longimicrobium sp.]|uniref:SRPBCC domain-containing protein n=1 Tax=Longimicrobium sp. TaxID=2029185 RepID=UPI002E347FD2|nr:SRPBCC domain-containing protein [Longimicrobium sp.]HEX6040700.1 SRPBCC domain-containing protein [Longimicrobium sp.]
MSEQVTFDPRLDIAIERFIDAPVRLVWEALSRPEHLKEWYMPRDWGRVAHAEMDLRPGGILRIDIAVANGQDVPNLGCILEVVPMERLVWTSMLFPGYRPAVFDDVPITAIMSMERVGTGTRYVFTALHRDEADLEANRTSGWLEGTEIALDQFVAHVMSMSAQVEATR